MEHEHVEIQLGHLCNNRCVFCVSGQLSEWKQAGQIPSNAAISRLKRARDAGAHRVTLLGGEPTLQKGFFDVLRAAQELGYREITIFTNGVMASKEKFLNRVLELGSFTWRFSLQGADEASHDAVTKNPGSFNRIVQAMRMLGERGEKITSNLCVTSVNVDSLPNYPKIVQELGIQDVHLDMVRPLDSGERTDDYLKDILPPYPAVAQAMMEMIERFPPGFDVHIGNLPYCVLPEHADRIFHDGMRTMTFAANGRNALDDGWDKYETKRRDKTHPEVCDDCAFRTRCNGIFEKYVQIHGTDGIGAIERESLWDIQNTKAVFPVLADSLIHSLSAALPPPGHNVVFSSSREHSGWLLAQFKSKAGHPLLLAICPRREEGGALASSDRVEIHGGHGLLETSTSEVLLLINWLLMNLVDTGSLGSLRDVPSVQRIEDARLNYALIRTRMATLLHSFPDLVSQESPVGNEVRFTQSLPRGTWVSLSLRGINGRVALSYSHTPDAPPNQCKEALLPLVQTLQNKNVRPAIPAAN